LIYQLSISRSAKRQIRDAAVWWIRNRPAAREAFAEDLEAAFARIQRYPHAGMLAIDSRIAGARRVLLPRVSYLLYYVVATNDELVTIMGLKHTARGPVLS
jgi:plasmid stabilization system protein ParE